MSGLINTPSRQDVLKFISHASSYGNLGLFVGAGLSKAVLNDTKEIALSWGQLLEKASGALTIEYAKIQKEGFSYPQIASTICQTYSQLNRVLFEDAVKELKTAIAELTCWYPDQEKRERFSKYLTALAPAWIITTNYDLVIEAILTGRSIPLGPSDQLISPKEVVAVYHLHGRRTNPSELIIVQEDYVTLFRPSEYRQIKLALTVKESTTLIIGYALGDVNVLTALDWSRHVFAQGKANYPHEVIQVFWRETPHDKPYRDKNGIVIIETSDLANFFEEYLHVREAEEERERKEKRDLERVASELAKPSDSIIKRFIDDHDFREAVLSSLSKFKVDLIAGFISFLDVCIEETWKRSRPRNAFEAYDQNLSIILDLLTAFDTESIPPALFQSLASGLNRIAWYVGRSPGESYAAAATWEKRKGELTAEMIIDLKAIANQHGLTGVKRLLDPL